MPQKPRPLDYTRSMRDWWGVELRNWRRVRNLSSKALGEKAHVSGTTIERIEKNERPCDLALVKALDDALDAGGALCRLWRLVEAEANRGLGDADNAPNAERAEGFPGAGSGTLGGGLLSSPDRSSVERRVLLALSGLAAAAPRSFTDLLPDLRQTALPRTVRAEDIEQVRVVSSTLAGWDNLYGGGGIVRSALAGQLSWAKGLLEAKCSPELESDLFSAVGRLSIVMGASAFDAYEHRDAVALLEFGRRCAEQADDWHLRANALNWLARQAVWCGSPDRGLTHAESGLVRSDRLTAREQAMLHNAAARAWAKMERPQEAVAAIGRSDTVFSRARDAEDAPWMAYYDNAQHHGDTGHALFDLALLDERKAMAAASRLRTAISQHTDQYVRSRAISGTKLATLIMAKGDPQEAVAMAHQALDEVGRLRSKRAAEDVRELAAASTRYARDSQVAALRARLAVTVRA